MSFPECLLWNELKRDQIGFHVRRQTPIGPSVLDFYLPQVTLCVEIDGESAHLFRSEQDRERDLFLLKQGIATIRFDAKEVLADPRSVAYRLQLFACDLTKTLD